MMAGTKRLDSWVVSSSKRPAAEVGKHAAESEATNEGSDIMQGTTSESESRQEPGQSSVVSHPAHLIKTLMVISIKRNAATNFAPPSPAVPLSQCQQTIGNPLRSTRLVNLIATVTL